MFSLDMRTIIFGHVVTDIVCLLVILLLWRQSRKRFAGMGFWVFNFACQTAAMLLVISRGSIPDWMSMVLPNTFVIGGAILGYVGLGRLVGKKISQVHNYVLLTAFACVHAYFTLVQPSQAARSLNITVGLLIIFLQCTWFLLYRVDPGMRRLMLGVGLVFGAYCLVSIVRIVELITGSFATNDFFQSGSFESLVLISYQVLFILLTYSLVLMVNRRLLSEVKSQEEKFAKAFHSSPYALVLAGLSDGRIVEVNDGFMKIAGYSNAEVVGKTTIDLNLWAKEEDRKVVVNELSTTGKVQGREFEFRKKSGEMITGLFSAEIIPFNDQKYVLSSISDITERKKAEEALLESEREFAAMFERSVIGMVLTDPATSRMLRVNKAFADMLGYSIDELCRMTFVDITHPEDRERDLAGYDLFRKGSTGKWHIEKRYIRKDGSIIWVDVSSNIFRYEAGRPYRTLAIIQDITGRKQADEALKRSEEKYRDLIKYAPTGIYEVDFRVPRFTSVNEVMCEYLGYSREELLQMNPSDIMDEKDASLFRERIRKQLYGEKIDDSVEYRVKAKDGREYYANLNITFTYEDGKPKGAMVIAHDVTERKKAEEKLRESQTLLSAIMENTPDPVYIKDDQSRIIMANPALAKVVGKPLEEVIGKTDSEYYEDLVAGQALREHDLRVMKSGRSEVAEETVPTPEGYRTFLSSKTPFRNASGDIIGITGISRDITERKRAEEALHASEDKFSKAFGYSPNAITITRLSDGKIIEGNESAYNLFGYSHDEVVGKTTSDLNIWASPADRSRLVKELSAKGFVKNEEFVLQKKDGTHVPVDLSASFITIGDQKCFLCSFIDITKRKRAEEELQQRTLELQNLAETLEQRVNERTGELANLSSQLVSAQENERKRVSYDLHDNVWQMLLAIRFNIESLFSSQKDWEALRRKSKEVTAHILAVVGKIRSMQGDLWPYVLDDIGIQATIDWYCREFGKDHSGLTVETHVDLGEHEVPSSVKIVIYRVMQEAMSNVAKHSKANHVSLSLVNKDHSVEFAIVDNGIGFDPEETLAKRAPWGGLGLLSIKARAELSGGTFEVESIKRKGTTIRASWAL